MILLHKILAIKGFYYLFLLAIHRAAQGKPHWLATDYGPHSRQKYWGHLEIGLGWQEDQVPKCNDQHCQWLHPPFLYCFSCYWWSIQEDTIGKVWSRRKQKGTVVEIGQSNVKVFFCCRWIYVSRFWILQPAMPFQNLLGSTQIRGWAVGATNLIQVFLGTKSWLPHLFRWRSFSVFPVKLKCFPHKTF